MEEVKRYSFSTVLGTSYEDAISRVTDALKEEGFGVHGDRCKSDPEEEAG